MLNKLAKKLFGSRNERIIKNLNKVVHKINALEESVQALSDEALQQKTQEFKQRLEKESLNDILPEAFAVVREASKRVLGLRHYDVQLIGGMVLHQGKIAEMRTGEGKTLVATLAVYLNALTGKGVHVVTVNDYLARRDGMELGALYAFLGLSTGIIVSGLSSEQRQAAYNADITYGTNNEFGFDYLRSNMVTRAEDRLQRELNFAIVDEVDSILIDEARTPLIISGEMEVDTEIYKRLNKLVPNLKPQQDKDDLEGDFSIDEKSKQVALTDKGHDKAEELLRQEKLLGPDEGIYDPKNLSLFHYLNACLKAHYLFQKDVDYIVRDGTVMIVDEFTGRTLEGRRWSDGIHQAIEVKEGVNVKKESQTFASITYQNYFRLYDKLAGMTGTADTEAFEFQDIYNLETVVIPTNKPVKRKDYLDKIYLNQQGKNNAILEEVRQCVEKRQPVLLGTASIETSELLSDLLKQAGIEHNVLNAKQHEREAEIIAHAGRPGMVTIATNMAGRGTDIVLGGSLKAELSSLGENASEEEIQKVKDDWQKRHDEALSAGGLHVIGAERHESRRIDNQLRGRSGRQGDNGSSRFYVALDDNLVRIFAGEKMASIMARMGMNEKDAIESKMITKKIEGAQRKVEAFHFDSRKNLLDYDNVANEQRRVIYHQRNSILDNENIKETILSIYDEVIYDLIDKYLPPQTLQAQWSIDELENAIRTIFNVDINIKKIITEQENITPDKVKEILAQEVNKIYQHKEDEFGEQNMRMLEKYVALEVIDKQWRQHLSTMDVLRQAIWLRSRAQKDPRQEYKRESFDLFNDLLLNIQYEIVQILSHIRIVMPETEDEKPAPESKEKANLTRNSPCHCGSGKKYKECHGKLK